MMQIAIQPDGAPLDGQVRAYIEYRMFSAVSRFGAHEGRVSVSLEERSSTAVGARYCCTATIELEGGRSTRAYAWADGAYAAVDRAAQQLGARLAQLRSAGAPTS